MRERTRAQVRTRALRPPDRRGDGLTWRRGLSINQEPKYPKKSAAARRTPSCSRPLPLLKVRRRVGAPSQRVCRSHHSPTNGSTSGTKPVSYTHLTLPTNREV